MFYDLLATQNRALVLQFYKAFDNRRQQEGLSLLSTEMVAHMAGIEAPLSQADFINVGTELYNAFPDGRHSFTQVIAHKDTVVTSGFFAGTHLGPFQGLPPTGKAVRFAVMHIDRVSHSKIVEHWGQGDSLSLVQQLGVKLVPGPGILLKMGLKAGRRVQKEAFSRLSAVTQPDQVADLSGVEPGADSSSYSLAKPQDPSL
ncbi:ester cyclase [Leptolyngbya sp. BC1307]|uniref:ester cyclase n=1 Tax=Leptolyngbya sp. BC1307 TaxID=2029589 RepID=UPI000EFA710B|nr:ester cyclase [Leptolyngbya sp. BC1307]